MGAKFERSEYYKYIRDNKITDPDFELFVRFAKMKGQTEEEMRNSVSKDKLHIVDKVYSKDYQNDLPNDNSLSSAVTKKQPKKTVSKKEPYDNNNSDELDLIDSQIKNLNKIKDTIRNNLSTKQRVDLRRYLSND